VNLQDVIYDVDNWFRIGRGRELQFFATDDEVQSWLLNFLPEEYAPYSLVGADLIKKGKIYIEQGFEFDISELEKAMYEKDETRWHYWIRSKVLTPELRLITGERITWTLSYSGLVSLQHGRELQNMGRDASSIGIVERVKNEKTGEIRHHKDYLRIFNSLKRKVKRTLCYSTIHKFKNGTVAEDTRLQLMTEKAVRAYEDGLLFKNAPGRRLK